MITASLASAGSHRLRMHLFLTLLWEGNEFGWGSVSEGWVQPESKREKKPKNSKILVPFLLYSILYNFFLFAS